MDKRSPERLMPSFSGTANWFDKLSPEVTGQLILGASDIALVLDSDGIIRDIAFGANDLAREGYEAWRGQAWIETVTVESRKKVQDLLDGASSKAAPRFREINHPSQSGIDIPIRYSAVKISSDGPVVALGRDLRNLSALQRRLVEAQQAMEREYARMRFAETRYRMLFQLASEPVIIVDAASLKVIEANPAAQRHLASGSARFIGEPVINAFVAESCDAIDAALKSARVSGQSESLERALARSGSYFTVSASLFRQDNASYLLVRLTSANAENGYVDANKTSSRILTVLEQLPDGFVVIDPALKILEVNQAFLDLAQLASKQQAIGESFERWLGRPGVDMPLLMSSLEEHGAVRAFATIIRGNYGSVEEVEVSAVPALTGETPSYGFVLRSSGVRAAMDSQRGGVLPRSVEHLSELIGRVTLKEMVRETTDVIERLCIEAALELSKDNRASAAQMLGLSRQSFYAKMRRYGLGDLNSDELELN